MRCATLAQVWNNATGLRGLKITVNSTVPGTSSKFSNTFPTVANVEAAHGVSEYGLMNEGDVIRAYVFQNSGGALSGGGPYFGDIRGRLSVVKVHDSFPPELTTETE